ncbi:hypothetical protein [Burkholderia gladioli]|uniref:hypothetical protein n=1 Tax=Burkholderia gladioli TaxID=28095 RepID=UPI00163E0C03|nr:hypothetical protein [Burkholderia gladioli]
MIAFTPAGISTLRTYLALLGFRNFSSCIVMLVLDTEALPGTALDLGKLSLLLAPARSAHATHK